MKIAFDCRYIRIGRHDGISRFTAGLVTELAKLHPVTMLISDKRQLQMLPELPWLLVTSPTSISEPFIARKVRKLNPDVVFSPMQTMGSWGRNYALLLTLHDLIYYQNRTPPRDLPTVIRILWRLYHLAWWPQRLLLNRADGVVTVSQTTANLIADHRLTKRRVTVIPNACDQIKRSGTPRKNPCSANSARVLVYMGSFMPYKNVATLAKAMEQLPEFELHLMSKISNIERSRLSKLAKNGRIIFHDGASDEEYTEILTKATALVTASKAEGFGIPLIEAMSCGTPIVVSDIPIFREIANDVALFFDPDDPADFVRSIKLLDTANEWNKRSIDSVNRASQYTWANSASKLLELMKTSVERRKK